MFTLTGKQHRDIMKWQKEHETKCAYKGNVGAIGGAISYSFTPTSLGMIIKVKCSCSLRDGIDVSDYENW